MGSAVGAIEFMLLQDIRGNDAGSEMDTDEESSSSGGTAMAASAWRAAHVRNTNFEVSLESSPDCSPAAVRPWTGLQQHYVHSPPSRNLEIEFAAIADPVATVALVQGTGLSKTSGKGKGKDKSQGKSKLKCKRLLTPKQPLGPPPPHLLAAPPAPPPWRQLAPVPCTTPLPTPPPPPPPPPRLTLRAVAKRMLLQEARDRRLAAGQRRGGW